MNKLRLLLLVLLIPCATQAQKFLWDVDFDTRFDNREYKGSLTAASQTLFSSRLTPTVGLGWGNGNALKAGVDLWADFGAKDFSIDPQFTFYYEYNSKNFNAYAGVLPRRNIIGNYSNAFFSDSVRFYDANIDGMLLQYVGRLGYIEFACDWNSRQSDNSREKFMLFSSGQLNKGSFFAGYNFAMYHHAGTTAAEGVVDNLLINPYVGVNLTRIANMDSLTIQGGWLQAFQNDRYYVGEYVKPGGLQIEVRAEKFNFGVYNTFYTGKSLMPYYEKYGAGLYMGETFYRTGDIYNRLELYWHPIHKKGMDLKVSSIHHYDGRQWGWQQFITFAVRIGKSDFAKPKRSKND